MGMGRLAARAVIGGLFVGHGTQKLLGWFGGDGLDGTAGFMESLQLHPGKLNAIAAGVTETAGGAMIVAGLGTPFAAAGLTGAMTTAISKVHLHNGPFAANNGWELNAVMIAAVTVLAETGPGPFSLDHYFDMERTGARWALAALATGVSAAALTMAAGGRASANAADAGLPAVSPAASTVNDLPPGDPTTADA